MEVIRTKESLFHALEKLKKLQTKLAFVPTMGNLHDGHLKLVEAGKRLADNVVVSIFVNKKQFGANEDFDSYPRTEMQDIEKLEKAGVALVYAPKNETEIFGNHFSLTLDVPSLTNVMCGACRPHFFGGVLAVVSKLFLQIKPNFAIFGKKDYQQFLVVSALAESLEIGVEVVGIETAREESGLAFSSRNNYLSSQDRQKASFIFQALLDAKTSLINGEDLNSVLLKTSKTLQENGIEKLDYLEVRSAKNLNLVESFNLKEKPVIFFAGFFKGVRLIDNLEFF
jgi:pantoate--beta-alanine ligase